MSRAVKLGGLPLLFGALVAIALGAVTSMGADADSVPPEIDIIAPSDGAVFILRQPVIASWEIHDPLPSSGIQSIYSSAPDGAQIDTASPGRARFTVAATDGAGNQSIETVPYWVVYRIRPKEPFTQGAFAEADTPVLEVEAGREIGFGFAVRDFFDRPIPNAIGTLSVLDSDTREIIPVGENAIGLFTYDEESQLHRYVLATSGLQPGDYLILVQFDDTKSIFRVELRLRRAA